MTLYRRKKQRGGPSAAEVLAVLAVAALAFLEISESRGADTWITASVASYHSLERDGDRPYNQNNWGLGIEYRVRPTVALTAGEYRNSFDDRSRYAGAIWTPLSWGITRFGLVGGVIDGYQGRNDGHFAPIVVPTMMFEDKRLGANVIVGPNVGKGGIVIGLQLKVKVFE